MRRLVSMILVVAFLFCAVDVQALSAGLMLPGGLKRIEEEAFYGDRSVTGLVSLPSEVESIGDRAFSGAGLHGLKLGNKVASVGSRIASGAVYVYATGTGTVYREDSLQGVKYAFGRDNTNIAGAGAEHFVALGDLLTDGLFYYQQSDEGASLLCAIDPEALGNSVTVPETVGGEPVAYISADAFENCGQLQSVRIPRSAVCLPMALSSLINAEVSYYGEYSEHARRMLFPEAPVLNSGNLGTDAETAPDYEKPDGLEISWDASEDAVSYGLTLARQNGTKWETIVAEQGLTELSYSFDAALLNTAEKTLFRVELYSRNLEDGEPNTYYFTASPVVKDPQIYLNNATAVTWNQASQKAGTRIFDITSSTPWDATTDSDWITIEQGVDTLTVSMGLNATGANRQATVNLENNSTTATLTINQGKAYAAPEISWPAMSNDSGAPSAFPTGNPSFEFDKSDAPMVRITVYEKSGSSWVSRFYVNTSKSFYSFNDPTRFKLENGKNYRIRIMGIWDKNFSTYEQTEMLQYTDYYVTAQDSATDIKVNNKAAETVHIVDSDSPMIMIYATGRFTVTADVDWLELNRDPDIGLSNYYVWADDNMTAEERTGHLTLTCNNKSATITVIQASMLPVLLQPQLSTNSGSPTSLKLADVNMVFRGSDISIAKKTSSGYTQIDEYSGSSFETERWEVLQSDLTASTTYRVTVGHGGQEANYYFKTSTSISDYVLINNMGSRVWYAPASAGSKEQKITASGTWTASSDASWLTVTPTSGSKNTGSGTTVTFKVTANTTGNTRRGTVTFKRGNYYTAYYTVEQAADNLLSASFEASGTDTLEASGMGDSYSINMCQSEKSTFASSYSWITLSSMGTQSSTIYIDQNNSGAARTGTFTFTLNGKTVTMTVHQGLPIGTATLTSHSLSTDQSNPTLIQYGPMHLTWNQVPDADHYRIKLRKRNTGSSTLITSVSLNPSVTEWDIPQSMLELNGTYSIMLYTYDSYDNYTGGETQTFMMINDGSVMLSGQSNPREDHVNDLGKTFSYAVQCSGNWTATKNSNWITLNRTSGAAGSTLEVQVAENRGETRTGTVTVTCGNASTTLTIQQEAYLAKPYPVISSPTLSGNRINPTILPAGTKNMTVTWDYKPQAEYYQLSIKEMRSDNTCVTLSSSKRLRDGNGSYTFNGLTMETGKVYVLAIMRQTERWPDYETWYYFCIGDNNAYITIDDGDENIWLDGTNDYSYVGVNASGAWSAKSNVDWLMVFKNRVKESYLEEEELTPADYEDYLSATNSGSLCISATTNNTGYPRTGTVTLRCNGKTATVTVKQNVKYSYAEITNVSLSQTSSTYTLLPYKDLYLSWTAGEGGTGSYEITLKENDEGLVWSRTLTGRNVTIPKSVLKEGGQYRLFLGTEATGEDDIYGNRYYFTVGYENMLTASASVEWGEMQGNPCAYIHASASGGSGTGYKYAYIIYRGTTKVDETTWMSDSYYTFQAQEPGDYRVKVFVKDSTGTQVEYESQTHQLDDGYGRLSGRVTGTNGNPVPGVSVKMYSYGSETLKYSTQTGTDGTWSIENILLAEDYVTCFQKTGYSFSEDQYRFYPQVNGRDVGDIIAYTEGEEPTETTASIGGVIRTGEGESAQGISVYASPGNNPDQVTTFTQTNANGEWQLSGIPIGKAYILEFVSSIYTVSPARKEITLTEDTDLNNIQATILSDTEEELDISFTMKQNGRNVTETNTGEAVLFTVTAPEADYVRLVVDGIPYETTPMPANGRAAEIYRTFNKAGVNRAIQFQAGNGNGWGTLSETKYLTVKAAENLQKATFITEKDAVFDITDNVTIAWQPVPHATGYAIDVYYEGVHWWEPEELITDEFIQIPQNVIQTTGNYSIDVIAVGPGYSQSTSGLCFTVSSKDYPLTIQTPKKNDRFIMGDTLYFKVENPQLGYVILTLTDEDGGVTVLPEEGVLSGEICEVYYAVPKHGTFTVKAYASPTNYRFVPEYARSESQPITIYVDGATVSNVRVGDGMAYQFCNDARLLKATTNNAVDRVEVYEGDTLLDTLAYEEENYKRIFTGQAEMPSEGFHRYVFKAYDTDSNTEAERKFGFYAINEYTCNDIYPKHDGVEMRDGITTGSLVIRTLYISDKVDVWGKLGEYYYVQLGNDKGFVKKTELRSTQVTKLNNVYIRLINPADNGLEFKQSGHMISVRIDTDYDLPASMKYIVSVVPRYAGDQTNYHFDLGQNKVGGIPSDALPADDYAINVSIVNAENENIVYTWSDSVFFTLYPDYASYQQAMNYNPLDDYKALFNYAANVVRQNQAIFTVGGVMDDGTIQKVEIESLTNGEIRALVAIATGKAAENCDLTVVEGIYLADLFMRRLGNEGARSNLIDLEVIKDLLEYLQVESDVAEMIYDYFLEADGVIKVIGGDGKIRMQWSRNAYKKSLKILEEDKAAVQKYGNTMGKIGTALSVLDAMAKIIDAMIVYSSVSNADIDRIVPLLQASGYAPLQKAAGYMSEMKSTFGKIAFLTISIGGQDVAIDLIENGLKEYAMNKLIEVAGSGPFAAFLVGCDIGAKVGTTVNNTFLNIDGIYQAAYKTQWCANAAEQFYHHVFVRKAEAFNNDPAGKRGEMQNAAFIYTELTGATYSAFAKVYQELDNAWVNQISNWFTHDEKNANAARNCESLAAMMRTYLDYSLSDECIGYYVQ